jgi:hypothetical protein
MNILYIEVVLLGGFSVLRPALSGLAALIQLDPELKVPTAGAKAGTLHCWLYISCRRINVASY